MAAPYFFSHPSLRQVEPNSLPVTVVRELRRYDGHWPVVSARAGHTKAAACFLNGEPAGSFVTALGRQSSLCLGTALKILLIFAHKLSQPSGPPGCRNRVHEQSYSKPRQSIAYRYSAVHRTSPLKTSSGCFPAGHTSFIGDGAVTNGRRLKTFLKF